MATFLEVFLAHFYNNVLLSRLTPWVFSLSVCFHSYSLALRNLKGAHGASSVSKAGVEALSLLIFEK